LPIDKDLKTKLKKKGNLTVPSKATAKETKSFKDWSIEEFSSKKLTLNTNSLRIGGFLFCSFLS
jgi:hypothetical protein